MAISSVSLTYFSMVSTPSANTPMSNVASAANDSPVTKKASCDDHAPRRRNVLVDAMMSALRELGLTKPATPASETTTSTTGAATPTAPATTAVETVATNAASSADAASATTTATAPSLEDAVLSFAHALWQALRGDEGSRRRDGDDDDHHRRHHHHGHRHDRDYSRLASRVEALAVRIEAGAPSGSAGTPLPVATTPKLPGTDPVTLDAAAIAKAEAAAPVVTTTPAPTAPAVSDAPTRGSLAESFAAMLKLLRGGDQTTGVPAPQASLASFLHSLARGLDADRSAPSMSVVGVMINVSA